MQKGWKIITYQKLFCFILLKAFGQYSDHDQTILINEYQGTYDLVWPICYIKTLILYSSNYHQKRYKKVQKL